MRSEWRRDDTMATTATTATTSAARRAAMSERDACSSDSQFTEENDDELTLLESCMDCDEDSLYENLQDGVTYDELNEGDKSGRTGLSFACANGFLPILELLATEDEVDSDLADNDGNTPLIYAAQAGHDDVISFVLQNFPRTNIDHCNCLGFTALMKAAIQGRTRCAKLILFAGANPNRRDYGRGLCAEEWARFCGRHACADAIAKYIRSKKYFFKKTFFMTKEKWNSEPDLTRHKTRGNWIQRHLSFKKKKSKSETDSPSMTSPLKKETRCSSSPLLATSPPPTPEQSPAVMRRPSCIDGVIPLNIPKRRVAGEARNWTPLVEECVPLQPPKILETDYDSERQPDDGDPT